MGLPCAAQGLFRQKSFYAEDLLEPIQRNRVTPSPCIPAARDADDLLSHTPDSTAAGFAGSCVTLSIVQHAIEVLRRAKIHAFHCLPRRIIHRARAVVLSSTIRHDRRIHKQRMPCACARITICCSAPIIRFTRSSCSSCVVSGFPSQPTQVVDALQHNHILHTTHRQTSRSNRSSTLSPQPIRQQMIPLRSPIHHRQHSSSFLSATIAPFA